MSGELKSPVEEALENQPFGALQLRVVLLCALVQAFDGFDLGTIGMAAPSLTKACSTWLSIHSPQYSSRRSSRTPGEMAMPSASSIACTALIW